MKRPQTYSERARELGLTDRRPERLAVTTNTFLAMGDYAGTFLQLVIDEQEVIVRRRRIARRLCLAILLCALYILGRRDSSWLFGTPSGRVFLALSIATTLILLVLGSLQRTTRLQVMARTMTLRCGLHPRHSVGAIIDLLALPGQDAKRLLLVLADLLPRLNADDACWLNHTRGAILKRELSHQYAKGPEGKAFTIALLYALPRIGDRSFIDPVEKLFYRTRENRYDTVHAAAKTCLDALMLTTVGETLLRPSSEREALPPAIPVSIRKDAE